MPLASIHWLWVNACLRFDFLHRGHVFGTQSRQRRSAFGASHWSPGNFCLLSRLWQAEQDLACEHSVQLRFLSSYFHRLAGNSLSAFISPHSLHLRSLGFAWQVLHTNSCWRRCVANFAGASASLHHARHCVHRSVIPWSRSFCMHTLQYGSSLFFHSLAEKSSFSRNSMQGPQQ